ncbi:hypothetical protein Pcinc_025247 [Petrolisthes cinctipes]|uniref:Uncharacterized protein n=1 Tax=Petrolisthes cinctipes TaxID=88211 RepID=A0AAE1F972_PETCI|nr:hypothetical protein Pcinc_025247 [Petrolisthes cinctipes]
MLTFTMTSLPPKPSLPPDSTKAKYASVLSQDRGLKFTLETLMVCDTKTSATYKITNDYTHHRPRFVIEGTTNTDITHTKSTVANRNAEHCYTPNLTSP